MSDNTRVVQALEVADVLARRWWTVIAALSLGLAGALVAMNVLPKTYEASTTIYVGPSRLPQEFVRSQVTDDMAMRLAALQESVLSRPYLRKLAEDVYRTTDEQAERDGLYAMIRTRLEPSLQTLDERRGSGVFKLTFRDSDPARAANVVNYLAGLFIEENVKSRNAQATVTSNILASLAGEKEVDLDKREQAIASFKASHLYELNDQKDANLRLLEARQRDLESLQRELVEAQGRRDVLIAQRNMIPVLPDIAVNDPSADTPARRLARARRELAALRERYTDSHPLVRSKQRQVTELESEGATDGDAAAVAVGALRGAMPLPGMERTIDAQIEGVEREVDRILEQQRRVRSEVAVYQRRIENTPRVEQQLAELTKGYDVLTEKFRDYQSKLENARGSQKVEEVRQGEQFEVMERATPPNVPIHPRSRFVYPAAMAAAIAAFVGPTVAGAIVWPRVRSRAGLRATSRVPLMVTIGEIDTATARGRARRRFMFGLAMAGLSLSALVVAAAAVR